MRPTGHFNELTPSEAERLAFLMEEMGEALHAAGKVLRHGYQSYNPDLTEYVTNRTALERELGHVRAAMIMLCDGGELSKQAIHDSADQKRDSVKRWMHHQ